MRIRSISRIWTNPRWKTGSKKLATRWEPSFGTPNRPRSRRSRRRLRARPCRTRKDSSPQPQRRLSGRMPFDRCVRATRQVLGPSERADRSFDARLRTSCSQYRAHPHRFPAVGFNSAFVTLESDEQAGVSILGHELVVSADGTVKKKKSDGTELTELSRRTNDHGLDVLFESETSLHVYQIEGSTELGALTSITELTTSWGDWLNSVESSELQNGLRNERGR